MVAYFDLRDIQRKEMESSALVDVGKDFYKEVAEFLKKKREESKESLIELREYQNALKVFESIASKRQEKILFMALRSSKPEFEITEEEKRLFESIRRTIERHNEEIGCVKEGIFKEAEISEPEEKMGKLENTNNTKEKINAEIGMEAQSFDRDSFFVKIRPMEDVEAYRSGEEIYGPFLKGNVYTIPREEAEWLLKENKVELVKV